MNRLISVADGLEKLVLESRNKKIEGGCQNLQEATSLTDNNSVAEKGTDFEQLGTEKEILLKEQLEAE
jgi:hypothetical protein